MADLISTSLVTSVATSVNTNRRRKTIGATMYTEVKKAQKTGVHT